MSNRLRYALGALLVWAIGLGIPFGPVQAQDDTSQEEQNIELALRFYDDLNEKNFDNFDQFYGSRRTFHWPDYPGVIRSTPEGKNYFIGLVRAFPDYVITIESITSGGNVVVVHYTFRGTFEGEWDFSIVAWSPVVDLSWQFFANVLAGLLAVSGAGLWRERG